MFDDGHADVPDGVIGSIERVVVVGAGIAGLTVANALAHRGVSCVVVEARDRIGGRLHTVELAGQPVDLGGSWIHHPIGNPLSDLAERFEIACRGGDPLPELAAYDVAEGRRLSASEVRDELRLLYEVFPAAVDELRGALGPEASAVDGIDAFLRDHESTPSAARRARQGLHALIEAESSDLPERQSLMWMWNELEYGGDYFGDLPEGGYRTLVQALASGIDVRTLFDVADIDIRSDGVRVTSTAGAIEEGSHVVVTVPLGVLKDDRPRFSPPLPASRVAAIGRMGFGWFEKVVLRFETPFWRTAGFPHLMLFPRDVNESTMWILGLDAFGDAPALAFLIFHGAAHRMIDVPPQEASAWVLDLLQQATGTPCPEPIGIGVSSWARDPYSLGAYSHIPPEATPADADLLGEPLHGRLLFGGEHTQSARLAYADGAMSSGVREAKRLLRRTQVALGPIG